MKKNMGRNLFLIFLTLLLASFLSGCRKSPLLEKTVYISIPPRAEEIKPPEQKKEDEKDENMDAEIDSDAVLIQTTAEPEPVIGSGDAEWGADLTGGESNPPVIPTGSAAVVVVPDSKYMVTTVSEATQNPHWKSSIDYESQGYTGEKENGFFSGQGTYVWDDGEKYEGEWQFGFFDGQGVYTWADGDRYEGEWQTEGFSGQGTYTWASGSYYSGDWKDGVKEGFGTYFWANGDTYVGEWKAGVKEGPGTYTWADGSVYEGQWKYGIKEGQGVYRGADGTVFDGIWANDKFTGSQ